MQYKILLAPDPRLEGISAAVPAEALGTPQCPYDGGFILWQPLFDGLRETLGAAGGAGLAAPQIGVALRVVALNAEIHKNDEGPLGSLGPSSESNTPPLILINPVVQTLSGGEYEGEEGCLSVPGLNFRIKRVRHIQVQALGEDGEVLVFYARDWFAALVQHEVDHLDGRTLHDRIVGRQQRRLYQRKRAKAERARA